MTNGSAGHCSCSGLLHSAARTLFPPPGCPALRPAICPTEPPNSPIITSNCPSPTPLRFRQAEPTPSPPSLSILLPCHPPSTTTHCRWLGPALMAALLPPPPLPHDPAPQSPPPPSGLAGSRSCACAAWSAGALSGCLRLRSPLWGRPPECLMPWIPGSQMDMTAGFEDLLSLEALAAAPGCEASRIPCLDY